MDWKTTGKILVLLSAICFSAFSNADAVWIDVRTLSEHNEDHIEGDLLVPHGEIVQNVSDMFPDKSTEIHLYCRSGGRAGIALEALEEAGYTNVSNAGGIEDAREKRGLNE